MRLYPLIQNSSRYFSRFKLVYPTQPLTSTERHISSLCSHFFLLSGENPFLPPYKNQKFLRFLHHQYNIFLFSDDISPRSLYKIYQSVAIIIFGGGLLSCLLKYLGLHSAKSFDQPPLLILTRQFWRQFVVCILNCRHI